MNSTKITSNIDFNYGMATICICGENANNHSFTLPKNCTGFKIDKELNEINIENIWIPKKFCKVIHCRYPYSHNKEYHCCGICKKLGHGQIEHKNLELMKRLLNIKLTNLPLKNQCKFNECLENKSHKNSAHICKICGNFGHSFKNHKINIKCPNCKKESKEWQNTYVYTKCNICLEDNKKMIINYNCGHGMCLICYLSLLKIEFNSL